MVSAQSAPGAQVGRGRVRLAGTRPERTDKGTCPLEEGRSGLKKRENIKGLTPDPATRQPAAGPSSPANCRQREAGDRSLPDVVTTDPKSSGSMVRTTSVPRRTVRSGRKNSEKRKWWRASEPGGTVRMNAAGAPGTPAVQGQQSPAAGCCRASGGAGCAGGVIRSWTSSADGPWRPDRPGRCRTAA